MHCKQFLFFRALGLVQSQHINIPTDPTHHWDGPLGVDGNLPGWFDPAPGASELGSFWTYDACSCWATARKNNETENWRWNLKMASFNGICFNIYNRCVFMSSIPFLLRSVCSVCETGWTEDDRQMSIFTQFFFCFCPRYPRQEGHQATQLVLCSLDWNTYVLLCRVISGGLAMSRAMLEDDKMFKHRYSLFELILFVCQSQHIFFAQWYIMIYCYPILPRVKHWDLGTTVVGHCFAVTPSVVWGHAPWTKEMQSTWQQWQATTLLGESRAGRSWNR